MSIEQSYQQLFKVAPISVFIITLVGIGGVAVWWLMSRHIKDLKSFIDYIKGKG